MNYKLLNNALGWAVFWIATAVYFSTVEDTVSLWDCGEYISTANGLQVGHPPGAPLFNMIGRLFSAMSSPDEVALAINRMSALCSSFSILFLFWTITFVARKLATAKGDTLTDARIIAILGSGLVGSLVYTFSDSFWFSAVEGEVYAMSSFFTAIVVWAMFKWDEVADNRGADRWIIFIMFLIGLSVGVHLLNLLAIPAMGFIYYFRRYKTTQRGFIYAGIISILLLGVIQALIIPGLVSVPAFMERIFRNNLGMPFNIGTWFFFILLISGIVYGIYYSHKHSKYLMNLAMNSFAVVVIGYSCFGMILIRSQANTPIDENNPEDFVKLLSYLNREQYGDWPVAYGPYWNSEITGADDGNPIYMRGFSVKKGEKFIRGFRTEAEAKAFVAKRKLSGVAIEEEYFIADDRKGTEYVYNSAHKTVLPRMFSHDPRHIIGYKNWSGYDGKGHIKVRDRQSGKQVGLPTFGNNLQYMMSYQMGWMYWRYFMWNFAGRQNDEQGTDGTPLDGNWISGVNFVDAELVGDQTKLPSSMKSNASYNRFYMLPLILGLIGMFWQLYRDPKNWFVVFLLFFFTGIAIILYLNPKPYEPRERDYAYAGSFYAFAIWIGLGVYALFDVVKNLTPKAYGVALGSTVVFILTLYAVESGNEGAHGFSFAMMWIALVAFCSIGFMVMMGRQKGVGEKPLAIFATVICLSAPYLMAAEGWDDHNRGNRTAALDLAKNYLETCEPNAILFTHGDNDTFPLWYAQEVEGIRRDVRVVNLSLLGTDWYIDQMVRKAYTSEPVPFSYSEDLYRQGGVLDQVILEAQNPKFENLKFAIDSVKNEANHVKYQGRSFAMMNTNKFYLLVDKEKVRKNKIVPEEMMDQVVDTIKFVVPKSTLFKNDVMILDLIANFNWDRPVYFAGTADNETYLGMVDYFSMEGLNYKFVPIKTKSRTPNAYGKINTDTMYNNFMVKYKWGNMNGEGVYVDYYTRRLTNNYRLQFLNLAGALVDEGREAEMNKMRSLNQVKMIEDSIKRGGNSTVLNQRATELQARIPELDKRKAERYAKAKNVMRKCFEVMPEANVPFERIVPSFVPLMFEVGDDSLGKEILLRLVEVQNENLDYYFSVEPRFSINMMENISISRRILAMMGGVVEQYKQEELIKKVTPILDAQDQNFLSWLSEVMKYDKKMATNGLVQHFPELFGPME